ncbi:MAG TPA: PTS transporter subunit EIIC [Collinsella ihuae]|uniref:PTS transporter subunit EIIC n=1 Tax=Collinsella ihumii TaxID=1720204 RepID=A0A921IRQ0_9ACTN|nr:PTS transporter subunit EIIC [Collinsella ihumii]
MADNKKIAADVLEAVGGKNNVTYVTHCMTRLRFNLKDRSKAKPEAVNAVKGVIGSQESGTQFQVIIGNNVEKVYNELCDLGGFKRESAVEENLDAPKEKLTLKKVGQNILDYLSGSLTQLIPLLIGAAMFKTVQAVLGPQMLNLITPESNLYTLLEFTYNAGFFFMPIYLGYTASKKLGVTPVIGMMLGGILIAPAFRDLAGQPFDVYGIPTTAYDYSQTVLPILLSVWVLSYVERFFKRVIPDVLSTALTSFLSLAVMLPISLCLLAPLGNYCSGALSQVVLGFNSVGGFFAIAVITAVWEFIVMSGMHLVVLSVGMTMLAETGTLDTVFCAIGFAAFAVYGCAFGAMLRMRNREEKGLALGYLASGLLGGVTEPTLYGLCFRHRRTFAGVVAGGFAGGLYAGITHVVSYMVSNANVFQVFAFAGGGVSNIVNGCITLAICFVVAAIVTFLFGFAKDDPALQAEE